MKAVVNGKELSFDGEISVRELVKQNLPEEFKEALVCSVNGQIKDLATKLNNGDSVTTYTFGTTEGKTTMWHTTAHVLAYAVKNLYPNVHLSIGPAIEEGFYYDFDTEESFENLEVIEKEMKRIIKENYRNIRFEVSKQEAEKMFANEPYKLEILNGIEEGQTISYYKTGDFVDLCAGPHLYDLSKIKAVKLRAVTGAYWKGDSKNRMLKRIYGISFREEKELTDYLELLNERKRRDHNKLGRELEYFTTVDYIGQGLPIMMPNGARVLQLMQRFVEDEEQKRGYLLTKTPFFAKSDLYKISGHWAHYRDGMFIMGDEEEKDGKETFALRPMTCPFQFQVYLSKPRSYRDLPMRLAETSTLFRNESSGEMHGLIRVRQFTISEGHIICTPEQLEKEFMGALELANFMVDALKIQDDVSYRFSKWDENNTTKYLGNPDEWETVQNLMRKILIHSGIKFEEANGEAAFYGPKLDIQARNIHGKEDTIITIQIDFKLAERFKMDYIDSDGNKKFPYIVHRTSIGCYERTLAFLLEKYAGAFPAWLAPTQAKIIPVSEKHMDYANEVYNKLFNLNIRVAMDDRNEKVGYKIREAQLEKVPFMIVVGDKEVQNKNIMVRSRETGESTPYQIDDFVKMLFEKVAKKEF